MRLDTYCYIYKIANIIIQRYHSTIDLSDFDTIINILELLVVIKHI